MENSGNQIIKHPLIDTSKPWGTIRFIHSDGKEHTFFSAVNEMSGNRLSGFDDTAPTVSDDLKWVRSVFRDIRAGAKKIIAEEGNL